MRALPARECPRQHSGVLCCTSLGGGGSFSSGVVYLILPFSQPIVSDGGLVCATEHSRRFSVVSVRCISVGGV
jgi:hypothetical protein